MIKRRILNNSQSFNYDDIIPIRRPNIEESFYIKLDNYKPQTGDKIFFKFTPKECFKTDNYYVYFAARNAYKNAEFSVSKEVNSDVWWINYGSQEYRGQINGLILDVTFESEITTYINDENSAQCDYEMYLFGCNNGGNLYYLSDMEFYYLRIERNGISIHNYIASNDGLRDCVLDLVTGDTYYFTILSNYDDVSCYILLYGDKPQYVSTNCYNYPLIKSTYPHHIPYAILLINNRANLYLASIALSDIYGPYDPSDEYPKVLIPNVSNVLYANISTSWQTGSNGFALINYFNNDTNIFYRCRNEFATLCYQN